MGNYEGLCFEPLRKYVLNKGRSAPIMILFNQGKPTDDLEVFQEKNNTPTEIEREIERMLAKHKK